MDEFEIKAMHPTLKERIWTRDTLEVAKQIADKALTLGYTKAEVVNIFGGHRSNPIYTAEVIQKDCQTKTVVTTEHPES